VSGEENSKNRQPVEYAKASCENHMQIVRAKVATISMSISERW